MGLDAPSHSRSAMDITLAIRINSLAVVFNIDAGTEWEHLATTLRLLQNATYNKLHRPKFIYTCVFIYLYLHIHEG